MECILALRHNFMEIFINLFQATPLAKSDRPIPVPVPIGRAVLTAGKSTGKRTLNDWIWILSLQVLIERFLVFRAEITPWERTFEINLPLMQILDVLP